MRGVLYRQKRFDFFRNVQLFLVTLRVIAIISEVSWIYESECFKIWLQRICPYTSQQLSTQPLHSFNETALYFIASYKIHILYPHPLLHFLNLGPPLIRASVFQSFFELFLASPKLRTESSHRRKSIKQFFSFWKYCKTHIKTCAEVAFLINFVGKEVLAQMFPCESCKIFKNIFLTAF